MFTLNQLKPCAEFMYSSLWLFPDGILCTATATTGEKKKKKKKKTVLANPLLSKTVGHCPCDMNHAFKGG